MHKAKFKHRPVRYRCDRVWEDKYDDAGAEDGKTRRRRDFLALFGLDATWKYDASQTEESKEEDDQSTSPLRSEILDNVFERATSDVAFSKGAKKTKRDARYRNIVDDNNTITVGAAKRMVKALKGSLFPSHEMSFSSCTTAGSDAQGVGDGGELESFRFAASRLMSTMLHPVRYS